MDVNLDGNTITNAYLSDIVVTGAADLSDALLTLPPDSVNISNINATGTPNSTTYLRGDGAWANPTSGGAPVTLTGDAVGSGTGTVPVTVEGLNGTFLAGLATGLLKNTTATGIPSIAAAGTDYIAPNGSGYVPDSAIRPGGKLIYVSQAQGNDTRTGLSKYSYQYPFATYTAAISAAASGDTIVMTDGTFTSKNNLLVTGVNIVLLPGANFSVTGTAAGDCIFTDNGTVATGVIIAGYGQTLAFSGGFISGGNSGVNLSAASVLTVNNLNMNVTSSATETYGLSLVGAGTVNWIGSQISATGFFAANAIYNGSTGLVTFSGQAISTNGAAIVNVSGGNVTVGSLSDYLGFTSTGTGLTITSPQTIIQHSVVSTGFSLTFSYGPQDQNMVMTPSSTLATGTITFPADADTRIGQKLWISNASAYTITNLTVSVSGGTIYGYTTGPLPPGSIMFQKTSSNVWQQISPSAGVSSVSNSDGTLTISPTTGSSVASLNLAHANTWSAAQTLSAAGAASTPALDLTGAPYSGGTQTTNVPLLYLNDGAAPSTWSTGGTAIGVNAPSGFSGHFLGFHVNGGGEVFYVQSNGAIFNSAGISAGTFLLAANGQSIGWANGRAQMTSTTDGIIEMYGSSATFSRLQLGGTTSSFPAIGVSGTGLIAQLADGSANTTLTASTLTGTTGVKTGSTGTLVKVVKMGSGSLSSGVATISDATIVTTQCTVECFHLGTGTTANFGSLIAYPTGAGTAQVVSSNTSDNDTFTYRITTY